MSQFSENGQKMIDALKKDEFAEYIGLEFLELDEIHAKARFLLKDGLKNPYGTAHGGVLYSVADIVAGSVACCSGFFQTTVSGNFNYMLPGKTKDYIYVSAQLVRRGSHLTVMDVKIFDDEERLINSGVFTFFKTEVPSV